MIKNYNDDSLYNYFFLPQEIFPYLANIVERFLKYKG